MCRDLQLQMHRYLQLQMHNTASNAQRFTATNASRILLQISKTDRMISCDMDLRIPHWQFC